MISFRRRGTALALVAFLGSVATLALPTAMAAAATGTPAARTGILAVTTGTPAARTGTLAAATGTPAATTARIGVVGATTATAGVRPVRAAPLPPCTTEQWQNPANFQDCTNRLADLSAARIQCLQAPTPEAPDSGMAGWFVSRPTSASQSGQQYLYSTYGYAGYSYTTYDIGCIKTTMHPDYKFENTLANGEFMIATSIVGASNALRERAWSPQSMWGWADPLVTKATRAVYQKVFTVFGAITLAVVGLYLIWRSRQSDMSAAMTTAGWAVLVMVIVTAVAAWPTLSANLADRTLVGTLSVIHSAVGPPSDSIPPGECHNPDPQACVDNRPPAVRASDTATEGLLYRNWLRGELGSADSQTALKYGPVLYDAKSFSWDEITRIREHPELRQEIIAEKAMRWMKVAEQIKTEDPEAYTYLQGTQGMDRIGAGFIAILSTLFFAMFDLTASILVLLGFLIFRWAVIAAPILGTVGMLRPASAGLRRLGNAVVAAIFNIVIFGTGAAVYLYAVDLIMGTASLPGWLQVVLIWLTGVVGWLLLRPYRRITQLGGKNPTTELAAAGTWHRRFFRDLRDAASLATPDGTPVQQGARRPAPVTAGTRPENRADPLDGYPTRAPAESTSGGTPEPAPAAAPEPVLVPDRVRSGSGTGSGSGTRIRRVPQWEAPSEPDTPTMYTIYRPDSGPITVPAEPSAAERVAARRGG